jgi:hypothetical protein
MGQMPITATSGEQDIACAILTRILFLNVLILRIKIIKFITGVVKIEGKIP